LVGSVALIIFAVLIVATLYLGREIFGLVALAILLSFVLAGPVRVLQRMRVPRGIAVVGVVLLAFAILFALGSLIATQVSRLAGDSAEVPGDDSIEGSVCTRCGGRQFDS
jgi:predicted PurR-regulated permease PerM